MGKGEIDCYEQFLLFPQCLGKGSMNLIDALAKRGFESSN